MPHKKKWTRAVRGDEVFYVGNFAEFLRSQKLDKSTAYRVRKGTDKRSIQGWNFEYPITELPEDAVVWDDAPGAAGSGNSEIDTKVDEVLSELSPDTPFEDLAPIEKYRRLSSFIMNMTMNTALGEADYPTGWRPRDLVSVLEAYAKAWNIDPKKAMDVRSDADKIVDSAEEILKDGSKLFEQVEVVLDGYVRGFQQIHDHADAYFDKLNGQGTRADELLRIGDILDLDAEAEPGAPPSPKVIRGACRKWIDALRRIKEFISLARNPSTPDMDRRARIISESTHVLRYQLYVGRPDVNDPERASVTYCFGQIHARMAMRLWLMRRGALLSKYGIILPGETCPKTGLTRRPMKYDAYLAMLPPRHGKSDFVIHDAALNINQNPRIQMAVVHDKEGEASKILRATQNLFDLSTSQGRRNAVVFPGRRLAAYDNNKTTLRIESENPPRNPNFMAATVWGSGQGNNLDIIYGDDLVPQSDMTEHNKRKNRMVRFAGTWLTRLQGQAAHVVLTGYPRHHEDLMWSYYKAAQEYAKTGGTAGSNIMALRLPVGGPQTNPPFRSIWPEMYPAYELKRRYKRQNDAMLWAANYMLQPMTDDQKIVKEVRLYDVESADTERFLKQAQYHLSVDPAAKGDGTGDNAGVIVGALGESIVHTTVDGNDMINTEQMLYVVHEDEFPATQTELTQHMVAMTSKYPIDTAHTEVVTGLGSAIKESLITYYNISRVEEHPPHNKGKGARLRAIAPALENSDPLIPAKIAFPGRRPRDSEGRPIPEAPLELLPEFERIVSYVVNFAGGVRGSTPSTPSRN